jgi:S-adenosylmethionine decarboxylase
MPIGIEWVVEAHGCDPAALTELDKLRELFTYLVETIELHPVREPTWHQFPCTGGITGLHLLAESHMACHTFPEYGSLCLNIFCCRPRVACNLDGILRDAFGASCVHVRTLERRYMENV